MVTRTDIANRALQRCGSDRIAAGALFTDVNHTGALEIAACYESLREAELRRNVWRFATRKIMLRAIDDDTRLVTFPAYSAATSYLVNSVVSSGGLLWSSSLPDKIATFTVTINSPGVFSLNAHLFVVGTPVIFSTTGALPTGLATNTVYYVIATGLTANAFEVSATLAGAAINTSGSQSGTHTVTAGMNIANTPSDDTAYWTRYFGTLTAELDDSTQSYSAGELVYDSSNVVYLSKISSNTDVPPTANWRILVGATLSLLSLIYPVGAGPLTQSNTRNVFMLPNGFLRQAPDDPSAGKTSIRGYPTNSPIRDWVFENDFITSSEVGPLLLRFCADIADPTLFDAMFVEGFACRIAEEVVERLTQSTAKLQMITAAYNKIMGEARTVNGIETGPIAPPIDDFIACRD